MSKRWRSTAALALALLVPGGGCRKAEKPPDIAELIADLRGPDAEKSGRANLKLIEMRGPAAPALAALLREGDARERRIAASTLWGLGPHARAAVPELTAAVADQELDVRMGAAMALEAIGPEAAPAVPALIRALKDRDALVRQCAAKALGRIGPAAAAAVPALNDAAKLPSVRSDAEQAVRRIQGRE